jgi:hypothetical protein
LAGTGQPRAELVGDDAGVDGEAESKWRRQQAMGDDDAARPLLLCPYGSATPRQFIRATTPALTSRLLASCAHPDEMTPGVVRPCLARTVSALVRLHPPQRLLAPCRACTASASATSPRLRCFVLTTPGTFVLASRLDRVLDGPKKENNRHQQNTDWKKTDSN